MQDLPSPSRFLLPLLLAAAPVAAAQTGPWTEGELIVRTTLPVTGQLALVRVDPDTGSSAVLALPQYLGGWSDSIAFDPFRGGLLANVSFPPDNTFLYRLWLVNHDGTATALPGFTGSLRALAPTGDGRVYFIRHTGMAQGPKPIEYFDAASQIHTLTHADGVTPFEFEAEHMLFHAQSNALIATSSMWWSSTHCGSSSGPSIYRIPLSTDGTRVTAPATCAALTSFAYGELMGLDHLPDGRIFVPSASGTPGAPRDMVAVDPVSLAAATWAKPHQSDIDGGVWSSRLQRAVLLTTGAQTAQPNGLRTYAAGSDGVGTFLPTSIALQAGGGFSPAESITEVDVNGPACEGFHIVLGTGLAGAGGHVPLIGGLGCPDVGSPFTVSIANVRGGAFGMLALGTSSTALPVFGGTLYVNLPATLLPISVGGAPGVPGAGSLAIPATIQNPAMVGISIYLQGAFLDDVAPQGISMTAGLRIQAG